MFKRLKDYLRSKIIIVKRDEFVPKSTDQVISKIRFTNIKTKSKIWSVKNSDLDERHDFSNLYEECRV